MASVLGIDVGEKKIGLAIGRHHDGWAFARPALLVNSWDEVWPELQKIMTTEKIDLVLVGLPLTTTGEVGPQANRIREFILQLKQHTTLPIIERDERHSSQAVQKEHLGRQLKRGEEDSLAAQLLVESYLMEPIS